MLSSQIVNSDAFLDMPQSSQLLYFHLVMQADDDGFVGSPKRVMRMVGANDDDFKILVAKRFILTFQSGVVVIKHWLIHNTIRLDRYHPTKYEDEKKTLILKENKAYSELRQPNGNQMETQSNLIEVNLIESNLRERTPADKTKEFFENPEPIIQTLVEKGISEQLARREITKFISYWTEPTKSGKAQRWEKQEAFEINRRLATWFSKINEFNKEKITSVKI